MMRFALRVAFGLIVTLLASSMAEAQLLPGALPSGPQPSRGFRGLSFGVGRPAPGSISPGAVSRPPNAFDQMLAPEGGRLPEITSAPEPHGTTAPCVMRVVPVDPRLKSSMPVVSVDKRADPKSVVTIPTCQPQD
jgi:hypothetical protein